MKAIKLILPLLLTGYFSFAQTTPWTSSPSPTPQTRTNNGSPEIRWLWGSQLFSVNDSLKNKISYRDTLNKIATWNYVASHTPATPTLQSVATAGNSFTGQIAAGNFYLMGSIGNTYLDLPPQNPSPIPTANRLKVYSDSLNRFSWKNSMHRRTLRVTRPSDMTITMPYALNPTLADSTQVATSLLTKEPVQTGTGYVKSASGVKSYVTAIPNTDLANSTISGVSLGGTLTSLIPGYGVTGLSYNGSSTKIWSADTTSAAGLVSKDRLSAALSTKQNTISILPIANGGTGSSTKNFVDLTTAQSNIAGAKVFTSALGISNNLTVGSGAVGVVTTPTDGLFVQGQSQFGTLSNVAYMNIGGDQTAVSGIGRGISYTGTLRPSANNDILYKADLTQGSMNVIGGTVPSTFTIAGGSGYVNGTYSGVAMTGGSGTSFTATIVVSGGSVTSVTNPSLTGSGYVVGNVLTTANTNLGGTGSGFTATILTNTYTGVTSVDLRANIISGTGAGVGRIGNANSIYYQTISGDAIFLNSLRGITNNGLQFMQQNGTQYGYFFGTGNLLLNGAGGTYTTDAGYRLDVSGTLRGQGLVIASGGFGRGMYLNHSLSGYANNDVLSGLYINNSVNLGLTSIATLGAITGGSGYPSTGSYIVTLTGGTGSGATANVTVSNGAVSTVLMVNRGTGYTAGDVLTSSAVPNGSGWSVPVATVGLTGVTAFGILHTGAHGMQGSTSGTITMQTQAAAGTYNWNYPTTAGTAGQVLTSQGGGTTAMTWTGPYQQLVFNQGAPVSVGGTTTETTGIGATGTGNLTLPANYLTGYKLLRLSGRGFYSTTTVAPTLIIKVYIGSVMIATGSLTGLLASASNNSFNFDLDLNTMTTGTSGSVYAQGVINYNGSNLTNFTQTSLDLGSGSATVNTTIANTINVTYTWSNNNTANTESMKIFKIESLN